MRMLGAACALVLAATSAAFAQAPPAPGPAPAAAPPATPEQIAKARAYADLLIAQAHAEAYFTNVTTSAIAEVRHLPSGVVCKFNPGGPASIHIFQSRSLPGEDVSCGYQEAGATFTLYMSRYPQTPTLIQELRAMVASVQAANPGVKKADGSYPLLAIGQGQTPPHDAVRMEYTRDGKRFFTRAASSIVGDWVIDQRVTGPFEDAMKTDLVSELTFAMTVTEAAKVKPDPARAAAVQAVAQDTAADEARRLLRGVSDPSAFVDLTAAGRVRLQHKASGLVCQFGSVSLYNHLLASGTGVVCGAGDNFRTEIWEIAYAPQMSQTQALEGMTKSVRGQFPDAQPLDGFADAPGTAGLTHVTRRFSASQKNGAKVFIRTAYGQVGDWAFYQRLIVPLTGAKLLDPTSEAALVDTLKLAADNQAATAVAQRNAPPAAGR